MCASVFLRSEAPGARAVARGAGAPSGGASVRGPRPGDEHDSLHHALYARDLDPPHECGLRERDDRLVILSLDGVGVAVEGSGVRVRLEHREGVEEFVEVLVHASACLDPEYRGFLVLSAAECLVVYPPCLGFGALARLSRLRGSQLSRSVSCEALRRISAASRLRRFEAPHLPARAAVL